MMIDAAEHVSAEGAENHEHRGSRKKIYIYIYIDVTDNNL